MSTTTRNHSTARSLIPAAAAALALVAGLSVLAMPAEAEAVPPQLSHQGRLLDDEGAPVTGEKTMKVTLYDAKTGGAILWQSEKTVQFDDNGYYSVTLGGSDNPIDKNVLAGGEVWLSVAIDGGAELKPRLPLNSAPFAVVADQANTVVDGGVTPDSLAENFEVGWDAVEGAPSGLDDGDDDTLGALQCTRDQIPRYNGQNWLCSPDGPQNLDWSKVNGVPMDLKDGDQDTLGGINCKPGQRAQYDGMNWTCVDAPDPTSYAASDQSCKPGEVVRGVDAQGGLVCATDKDTDTTRSDGGIVQAVRNADEYVTKKGDSTVDGNVTVKGNVDAKTVSADTVNGTTVDADTITAKSAKINGRIYGSHLNFRRCNNKRYDCTPKACQKLCQKNNERMAFFDEVFAWASAGNGKCAHMWMLDGDVPDRVVSAYPMYKNRTSSGCGPQNTGERPRMVARRVESWNTSLKRDCACATIQ